MSDIVRVLRLIEYKGPRSWVEQTLKRSLHYRSGTSAEGAYEITGVTLTQYPEILETVEKIDDKH